MTKKIGFVLLSLLTLLVVLLKAFHPTEQTYQGYVENENTYLSSLFSGRLVEAFVQRGQRVTKGTLLFKLDPDPQSLQIAQAKAALLQAKQVYDDLKKPRRPPEIAAIVAQVAQADSQVKLAALRVKRNETLYAKHVLDKDSLDASLERYQELTQLKAQFEANLRLAKLGSRPNQLYAQKAQTILLYAKQKEREWEMLQKNVYAPADGLMFDIYFKIGELVDAKRPLAALLTPENTRIEFFVPAADLPRLHMGKPIFFDCDGCRRNNSATIQYVSPLAEYLPPLIYSRDNMNKLVFRIKASIEHPDWFKPGQPVVVRIPRDAA